MSLWTPEIISKELWIDASDEDTTTLVDGLVSAAADKSGNGRHAIQSDPDFRPAYLSGELNGKNVLQSDGSPLSDRPSVGQHMLISHANWGSSVTVYSVARTDATHAGSTNDRAKAAIFDCSSDGNFGSSKGVRQDLIFNSYRFGIGTEASSDFLTANRSGRTAWLMYGSEYDESSGRKLFVDGSQVASDSKTGAISYSGVSNSAIMAFFDGTRSIIGELAEIVVLSRVAPLDERQKMEGYLMHKWGLQENLPTEHPYKDAPPHTGSVRRRRMMMMKRGRL
jgi:hypothetical protein